jgi:formamidopyrimidine-DNA glycosylase
MPELPELTVFAENLTKKITDKQIVRARYHREKRLNVAHDEFCKAVESAKIERVERVAKEICFYLDNGRFFSVHLMLNGGFLISTAKEVDKVANLILSISFEDGIALAVTDPKGLVTVGLDKKPSSEVPDGLKVTEEYLSAMFKKQPKVLVKPFLIDQARIGGIGNAYSDEILWLARISPKSQVGKLPPEAVQALVRAIPEVLNGAIAEIRKRRPDALSGEIRDFLKVHGPALKASPTGARIIKEQIQTKKTYYTEEQVLYQ